MSVAEALRDALAPALALPLDALPLAGMGLGWVLPALLAAALSSALSVLLRRRHARA